MDSSVIRLRRWVVSVLPGGEARHEHRVWPDARPHASQRLGISQRCNNPAGRAEPTTFSLVLGTIGRTNDLKELLASLDTQTYRNFEVIVVDQNPDDRLVPILEPYTGKFPLLHLRSEERGLSRAKNLGMERASGNIVGFLDDNCQFPPNLLKRVARSLGDHPEWDGLTGRSVDEEGRDSNGRFDSEAGPVDKYNAWRRGAAYNIFVRLDKIRGARFDEEMGPGAGTEWGAGDETDFLLDLVGRGASLFYDPNLIAFHPQPVTCDDEPAMRRAYFYACGASHAVKKHEYPLRFRILWVLKSVVGLAVALVRRGETRWPGYQWNVLKGKLRGLR